MLIFLGELDPFANHSNCTYYISKAPHTNLFLIPSMAGDNANKILALPNMSSSSVDRKLDIQRFTSSQCPVRVRLTISVDKANGNFFNSGAVLS